MRMPTNAPHRPTLLGRLRDYLLAKLRHFCLIGWRRLAPRLVATARWLHHRLPVRWQERNLAFIERHRPQWDMFVEECKVWFYPPHWADWEYVHSPLEAARTGPRPESRRLLAVIMGFLTLFLLWAMFAEIDEVVRGEGKVIPSSSVQKIQNLEGGIIEEVFVKVGDIVQKDQELLRIDATGFQASLGEQEQKIASLKAAMARLEAEVEGRAPVFPPELATEAPDVLAAEENLYRSRQLELDSGLGVLRQQVNQKAQEIREYQSRAKQQAESLELVRQELNKTEPLLARGIVPEIEVLRLRRQVVELEGDLSGTRLAIPRAQAAMAEAQNRVQEQLGRFKSQAAKELADIREQYNRFGQAIRGTADKVTRTQVRSPVYGTVKQIMHGTIGGVVQPGQEIMEIVPLADSLLIEAQILPKDVAFIRPGQAARVRLSAYDYTIYGALEATLENISADTVTDDKGNSFYIIRVRTTQNHVGTARNPQPIMPGMVGTVDILTGKKTILQYLMKPVLKARERALQER